MKKFLAAVLAMTLLLAMFLTGCGKKDKTVVLVVSFGTSYNDSREVTIGAIEGAIQAANPDLEVRRAFTSQIIIDKLKERDGLEIDNVTQALDRAVADGVTTLIVQPTHLMHGFEYTDLKDELANYNDKFDKIVLGEPLLNSDDDFGRVADALSGDTASYDDGSTAIVFMGHGTEADSNEVYAKMQGVMEEKGLANYYVGTVEATPSLDDVIAAIKDKGYSRVVLEPMMVVAGDHANNDMAGDEEDSWKTILTGEGYEVE
ncbi:MAG: sirohydrochlorin cobaltochelatase, partial [Lachnospiraceae bacterium]|nr:sirohydrochlorin cobaltochelatase [Lachnospiraceae bacterium]